MQRSKRFSHRLKAERVVALAITVRNRPRFVKYKSGNYAEHCSCCNIFVSELVLTLTAAMSKVKYFKRPKAVHRTDLRLRYFCDFGLKRQSNLAKKGVGGCDMLCEKRHH